MTSNIDESWKEQEETKVINFTKPPSLEQVIDKQIKDLEAIKTRLKTRQEVNDVPNILDYIESYENFYIQVTNEEFKTLKLTEFKETSNKGAKSLMFFEEKNDGIRVFINKNSINVLLTPY